MARTIQYSFPSKADGLVISCLALVPELGRDEKYRGIIQIVHGMSEYKERYLPFMEYMAEHKYVSVIHDHRGHGKSVRDKEDLGYMYGGGADAMLQDIHTVNSLIRDHFPEIPLILFGHSMGSLAVRAYAAHHADCMRISKLQCATSGWCCPGKSREGCFWTKTQCRSYRGDVFWNVCTSVPERKEPFFLDLFRSAGSSGLLGF